MKILNFKGFMKKYILKNITMNKNDLQRVYNYIPEIVKYILIKDL